MPILAVGCASDFARTKGEILERPQFSVRGATLPQSNGVVIHPNARGTSKGNAGGRPAGPASVHA